MFGNKYRGFMSRAQIQVDVEGVQASGCNCLKPFWVWETLFVAQTNICSILNFKLYNIRFYGNTMVTVIYSTETENPVRFQKCKIDQ